MHVQVVGAKSVVAYQTQHDDNDQFPFVFFREKKDKEGAAGHTGVMLSQNKVC